MEREILEIIRKRKSVRKFSDRTISDIQIKTLLEAGQQAPSVRNGQPWQYIVIKNQENKRALSALKGSWHPLSQSAVGLCMFVDLQEYPSTHKEFFAQDCAAATENILLTAAAMGIGSLWMGVYPNVTLEMAVKNILKVPVEKTVFNLIALGYETENERKAHRKEPTIYWECYGRSQ